jgi:hypothetical protein
MGNIGIIGRARVGKDTAGKWLVDERGYRRIGFADALKEVALKVDPLIDVDETGRYSLSDLVDEYGWEGAKETPEVRRFLQELGAAIRVYDPEFWLRIAMKLTLEANEDGVPAVITDVRYPNEAESLRRAGFHLIYIDRPDVPQLDHESEGALKITDAHHYIHNAGELTQFLADVEDIADYVTDVESRRHLARL